MGAEQSRRAQEERLERQREELYREAREQRLQETLRLERERQLLEKARQELEAVQLKEAIRRSNEAQLYPNLKNIAGTSRETFQANSAPVLVQNNEHFRYQPSAPPAPSTSALFNQSAAPKPPPSQRLPSQQSATPPGAVAAQSPIRASGISTQTATACGSNTTATSHTSETSQRKKVFTRNNNDNMSCKTCKKPFGDKIFQCKRGHSSCENCWSLDMQCGVCKGPITNTRNFDVENYIAANQKVKCPYADEGCVLWIKKTELEKHIKECPFKELKCPIGNCHWRGKISKLLSHFEEQHPSCRQANVDTEMYLPNICNEYNSTSLIKLGNFNFLFHIKVSEIDRQIYMTVQLIGTKTSASKWHYEIHVYNKSEPRRKYQYIDTCRSYHESPVPSLQAILPLQYAMSFYNEGNLTYKCYLKKNNQELQK